MEDFRYAENLGGLHHRAAKQGEALRIVVIIAQRCAVEGIAIEEWGIVYKVILHAATDAAVEHGAETIAVIERHGNTGDCRSWIFSFCAPVAGHVNRDLMAEHGQRPRQ